MKSYYSVVAKIKKGLIFEYERFLFEDFDSARTKFDSLILSGAKCVSLTFKYYV